MIPPIPLVCAAARCVPPIIYDCRKNYKTPGENRARGGLASVAIGLGIVEGLHIKNGAIAVAEGANMPCRPEAIQAFQQAGLLFAPAKAANAGGVATSGLEISQNELRAAWSFQTVDEKLREIMVGIFHSAYDASRECGVPGDLVVGANVAGFRKVADAMLSQGVV